MAIKVLIIHIRKLFSGFQTKLLLSFFLCTLLPLTIIALIFYHVTQSIAEDKIMDSAILSSDQLNTQINDRIQQAENVADSIQYDMYSLTLEDRSMDETLLSLNNVRNDISLFTSTFNFYHIYVFLPDNMLGAHEGLNLLPLSQIYDFAPADTRKNIQGTASTWFYKPGMKLPFIVSEDQSPQDVIVCGRFLQNQTNGDIEYSYMIFLKTDEFSRSLSDTYKNSEISSYLISNTGLITAHTNKHLVGTYLPREELSLLQSHKKETNFHEHGKHYHVMELDNGWYHMTEIPDHYLKANTHILLRTIIITLLIALPITILIIISMSQNLTKKLRILSFAMKNFSLGNSLDLASYNLIPTSADSRAYDEIDELIITFDKMQSSLNENMQSILDLSLSEEKLKYQLLQSQINPHFLYNILGSVKTCMTLGRIDTANQMITDLTRFYRLLLRNNSDLVSIKDELEICRLYLDLEKLCHNDTLTWDIYKEDGIENFMMCRFTLQPFLENSIHHGISRISSHIHINVSVCYGDDTVIITITDNGCGMTVKQLNDLKKTLKEKKIDYEKHYGIGNVNQRISSPSFGNGNIQIESSIGKGTRITILFDQMEEKDP